MILTVTLSLVDARSFMGLGSRGLFCFCSGANEALRRPPHTGVPEIGSHRSASSAQLWCAWSVECTAC